MNYLKGLTTALLVTLVNTVYAVPVLQLDIIDGFYDSGDETIVTSSDAFTLVAYGKAATDSDGPKVVTPGDTYYVSIALTPRLDTLVDFGSFDFDGVTYDHNNSGWTFGSPPLDGLDAVPDSELAAHGIFDTFFLELAFEFVDSAATTATSVNTQDTTGSTPDTSGDALFFKTFDVDVSLMSSFELHFDLYNSSVAACRGPNKNDPGCEDITVDDFAPFSHDAATIPEPGPLALLSLGLLALMLSARYKSATKKISL